jgi:hypothetical protein
MTQQLSRELPQELLDKLAAARTPEEVKAVLAEVEMEKETPNEAYARLRREFRPELEGVAISRQEAAEKYPINYSTISYWEQKGVVKVIEKARRRGMPSKISERDVAIIAEINRLFRTGGNAKGGRLKGFTPEEIN